MPNDVNRVRALELAIETLRGFPPGSPSDVTERATAYLKFLDGKDTAQEEANAELRAAAVREGR